jgi:hypothetical protein
MGVDGDRRRGNYFAREGFEAMKRYIHQDIRTAPSGSRVRTITRGAHKLRIAFPKGKRSKGTGRLVSILHPRKENPNLCKMHTIRKNPGLELVILGNPNKRRAKLANKNPEVSGDGVQLYSDFHGKDPAAVIRVQQESEERNEYVKLGDLVSILVKAPAGKATLDFEKDGVALASNPEGTQLYLIGGNTDLLSGLSSLGVDTSKDYIEIGEAKEVTYGTRKAFDQMRYANYVHEMGEHGGVPPILFFDKIKRRPYFVGGTYTVKPEGIVN